MNGANEIWVFAEREGDRFSEVVFELLAKAQELKKDYAESARIAAIMLGSDLDEADRRALGIAGADVIYSVGKGAFPAHDPALLAEAIVAAVDRFHPEILLAGATPTARAFLPRVAAKLGTGLTADCTSLEIRDYRGTKILHQTRPAFGGNLFATIVTAEHRPQMATVRPHVFKRRDGLSETIKIIEVPFMVKEPYTRLVNIVRGSAIEDISSAKVLISGGRGLENAENFAQLHVFARLIGAKVAASRAAVDLGWAESFRQVGQTGITVAPELYIAIGISGAIQHLVGIRGAKRIVAINRDNEAPIFSSADIGIVADAKCVIAELLKEFGHA